MIYESFAERLIEANKSELEEWPILWGDRQSDSSDKGHYWLEMRWRPNGMESFGIGKAGAIDQGFFRIRICIRRNQKTIKDMFQKAQVIRSFFRATTRLDCAYVSETPEISNLDTDDGEMMTFMTVTIRYKTFMLN